MRIATFCLWFGVFVSCLVITSIIVPRSTLKGYESRPKDAEYYFAHLCWYGVPLLWFFQPSVPDYLLVWPIGLLLFVFGGTLNAWALCSNPYYSPDIRKPERIVTDGAYRWLKHPGYTGTSTMLFGTWLMLGHFIGVVPLIAYVCLVWRRAVRENRLLASARKSNQAQTWYL